MDACWEVRRETDAEAAQEWVEDAMGTRIPRYVLICDGDEVTGPLEAEYIKRLFSLDVRDLID